MPNGVYARFGTPQEHYAADNLAFCGFSPDGKLLAYAGAHEQIHVWDVRTGKEYRCLTGRNSCYVSGSFSPDGNLLALADMSGAVSVWNLRNGVETPWLPSRNGRRTLPGVPDKDPEHEPTVAFSPDGKLLAAGGCDDVTLLLWDFVSGKELFRWPNHRRLAFAADGKFVATDDEQLGIHFLDVATGKEVRTVLHVREAVDSISPSPNGQLLATAGWSDEPYQTSLRLWDLSTGRQLMRIKQPNSSHSYVAFSPDSRSTAIGRRYGFELREVSTGGLRLEREAPEQSSGSPFVVGPPAFSPDGAFVATAFDDATVWLWKVRP